MRRIASNSAAAAGGRSTLVLLLLFVTDHLRTSLGSNDSPPFGKVRKFNSIYPGGRGFLMDVDVQRAETASSIINFKFDENRMRVVSKAVDIPKENKGIMYWMNRDHRVQDNWALLYAQKLAIQNKVPLHVVFCRPSIVVEISFRQFKFMCAGLRKVEIDCQTLNIDFHVLIGNSTETISHFVRNRTLGAIVVDFSPLRDDKIMLNQLVLDIGSEVPVIQVDAHNVVPCWLLAATQIPTTMTCQKRMGQIFDGYLTEFPPVIRHPYTELPKARPTDWNIAFQNLQVDLSIKTVPKYMAGYVPAMKSLNSFIKNKLASYYYRRLNPLVDGLSNLSPWLHFGHISAQRVLLEVMKFNDTLPAGVDVYKEEILIRRELLENYCYHNSKYDSIDGGPVWGRNTLLVHKINKRKDVHTVEQLENGQTGDFLWNAAHNQMKLEGKTHRFLRPYWAKKIIEFSKTPEEAIATANYLNNKYSLDGNDPAGFGEILWAITGLYDEKCKKRKIYGRIRYIYTNTLREKINTYAYIQKYNGSLGNLWGKGLDFRKQPNTVKLEGLDY